LAEVVGVHRGSVAAWESGTQDPSGDNLLRLSRALDTTPAHILYDEREIDFSRSAITLVETWEAAAAYLNSTGKPPQVAEAEVLIRCAGQVREAIERYQSGDGPREPASDPEKVAERGRQSIEEVPPEALQD